ncbi:unnamed protein product [Protopolystoma xenopodis]|uniref:Uncharacterized protein n=1 Tax=Protopolystoma xenopodis TaxID=117903 RepID=A0A3S4ZXX2_9PLAT|nr:unnamed protein product [Protopolystoma xenopodis]
MYAICRCSLPSLEKGASGVKSVASLLHKEAGDSCVPKPSTLQHVPKSPSIVSGCHGTSAFSKPGRKLICLPSLQFVFCPYALSVE